MKNSIYFNNSDDYLAVASSTTSMLLGLGSDVGVYFKDERGSSTLSAVRVAKTRKRGRPAIVNTGSKNGIFIWEGFRKYELKSVQNGASAGSPLT